MPTSASLPSCDSIPTPELFPSANHKDVKNKRVLDYVIIAGHDAAARGPLTVAESH
jgi:hypothetical protein